MKPGTQKEENIQHLPLTMLTLVRDPIHPLYDPSVKEKPDPILVESLRDNGQDTPLLVVDFENQLLIAAGRRRYNAMLELGWTSCDVNLRKATTESELMDVMIRENSQRKDKTLVQKAREMARYSEYLKAEYLESQNLPEGSEPHTLPEKELNNKIQQTFAITKDVRYNLELLAYHCSPKVIKMTEPRGAVKGKISESVAIEVARLFPDQYEKQEAHINKILNRNKGQVSQKTVKELGDRPFKTTEVYDLAQYVDAPKPVRETLLFISGKATAEEKATILGKFEWLRDFISGDNEDHGVGDDDPEDEE